MTSPAMTAISTTKSGPNAAESGKPPVYWRVEGSLLELSALAQLGFFTWNAQSFAERSRRRLGMALMTLLRPAAFLGGGRFATRLLYMLLGGVSRDGLDLLGEEYFVYRLKPRLRAEAGESLRRMQREGRNVVLVGESLEQVLRPPPPHGCRGGVSRRG